MSDVRAEYKKVTEDRGVLPADGKGLVELSGDDALEWLQGQATNDLRNLSEEKPISFCLCEPTGQLLAVCDLWKYKERLLIATDNAAAFIERAASMVILEDVEARDLSDEYELLSVHGPTADGYLDFFKNSVKSLDVDPEECIVLHHDKFDLSAHDIWVPRKWGSSFATVSLEAFEILRVESGVPKRGVDYTSKTLPPELGPAFESKHVSYNKGCYTGQEVLMRIHSRGHTNKTWVGLLVESPVKVGDRVLLKGKEVGAITSAVVSPKLGAIAAATLRNEATANGMEVLVGDVKGTVKAMPLI